VEDKGWSDAEKRLMASLKALTGDERKHTKRRLFDLINSMISAPTSSPPHPRHEAAIELYALKSFPAQDMSGRFNRSRMKQAIKEAKLEVRHD
jgi:hypothetical protein